MTMRLLRAIRDAGERFALRRRSTLRARMLRKVAAADGRDLHNVWPLEGPGATHRSLRPWPSCDAHKGLVLGPCRRWGPRRRLQWPQVEPAREPAPLL